jgi:hypothetical protein
VSYGCGRQVVRGSHLSISRARNTGNGCDSCPTCTTRTDQGEYLWVIRRAADGMGAMQHAARQEMPNLEDVLLEHRNRRASCSCMSVCALVSDAVAVRYIHGVRGG